MPPIASTPVPPDPARVAVARRAEPHASRRRSRAAGQRRAARRRRRRRRAGGHRPDDPTQREHHVVIDGRVEPHVLPSDPAGKGEGQRIGRRAEPSVRKPDAPAAPYGDTGPPSPGTALGVPGAAPGLAPDVEAVTALVDTVPPQRFARARTLPSRFRPADALRGNGTPRQFQRLAYGDTPAWRARPSPPPGPDRAPPRFPGGSPCAAQPGIIHVQRRAVQGVPHGSGLHGRGRGESASKTASCRRFLRRRGRRPSPLELARSFVAEPDVFRGCEGSASFVVLSVEPPEAPAPTPESALGPAASRAPEARRARDFRRDFFLDGGSPGLTRRRRRRGALPLQERQRLRLQARAEGALELLDLLQRHLPQPSRGLGIDPGGGVRDGARTTFMRRGRGTRRVVVRGVRLRRRLRLWVASSGTKRRRFPRGRSQAGPPPDSTSARVPGRRACATRLAVRHELGLARGERAFRAVRGPREGHAGATKLRAVSGRSRRHGDLDHFSHYVSKLGGKRRCGLVVTRPGVAWPRRRSARVDFGWKCRNDPRRLVGGGRAGRRSPTLCTRAAGLARLLLRREERALLKLEELLLGPPRGRATAPPSRARRSTCHII